MGAHGEGNPDSRRHGTAGTRRGTLGRGTARRQAPRREPDAALLVRGARCAYHRNPQFDLSGTRGTHTGEGGRSRPRPAPLPMSARALMVATLLLALFGCASP